MPADAVRTEIGRRRTSIGWSELFNLKRVFGMSVQAIVDRCRDLGIINNALFTRLFRDISRFGWRPPPYSEPQPIAPERPSRFERLCSRALAENVISEAKAAELLGMSVRDLHHGMEQPPTAVAGRRPLPPEQSLVAASPTRSASVPGHGLLGLLDRMMDAEVTDHRTLYLALKAVSDDPRCRLPRAEVNKWLARWGAWGADRMDDQVER